MSLALNPLLSYLLSHCIQFIGRSQTSENGRYRLRKVHKVQKNDSMRRITSECRLSVKRDRCGEGLV